MPRRGVLLLAFGLTGCINHWQPQQGPAALVVSRSTATEFRVTRTDGTQLTVDQNPHRFRLAHGKGLGREHLLHRRGADSPGP